MQSVTAAPLRNRRIKFRGLEVGPAPNQRTGVEHGLKHQYARFLLLLRATGSAFATIMFGLLLFLYPYMVLFILKLPELCFLYFRSQI